MDDEAQLLLAELSRDAADTLYQLMEVYPALYHRAQSSVLMSPGPTQESELMEIRRQASEWASRAAVISRLIDRTSDAYVSHDVAASSHPLPVRYLLQEIMECCVLLSGVTLARDVTGLPLLEPQEIEVLAGRPQTAAWIENNRTISEPTASDPAAPQPASDPSYAPPVSAPLAESPYPSLEPEGPSPLAPLIPEPLPPAPPPEQHPDWNPAGPPGHLPGDRRR